MKPTVLTRNTVYSALCLLLLNGCSWLGDWSYGGSEKAQRPEPQVKLMQTADSTWIDPQPGTAPIEHTLPASAGNAGAQARLVQLEQQVAEMRNDMSMMMPALTRLASVQTDLQAVLVGQIQPAAGASLPAQNPYQPGTGRPTPIAKSPHQAAARPAAAPPPATPVAYSQSSNGPLIKQVRFGEHPDKTRIVLDMSAETTFKYDLDNGEKILMIELPQAGWKGQPESSTRNSALISSYSLMPDGQGGTRIIMQLRQDVQVRWAQAIPAAAGKDPRVVIDITGL